MRRIIGDPVTTIGWRCYVCIYINSDNEHPRRRGERPRQKNLLHRPAELENPPRHQIAHWAIIAAHRGGRSGETGFLSTDLPISPANSSDLLIFEAKQPPAALTTQRARYINDAAGGSPSHEPSPRNHQRNHRRTLRRNHKQEPQRNHRRNHRTHKRRNHRMGLQRMSKGANGHGVQRVASLQKPQQEAGSRKQQQEATATAGSSSNHKRNSNSNHKGDSSSNSNSNGRKRDSEKGTDRN